MALTDKQQLFVTEYLQSYNATQAALRAGYSPKTAHATGWENLRKPEILEVIQVKLSESAMSADEVLMRLAEQARGDMGDFVTANGELDLSAVLSNGKSRLLKKITQKRTKRTGETLDVEEVTTSIELYDAQAALVHLGRHHKLFTDKSEVSGKDGESLPIVIVKMPIDEL